MESKIKALVDNFVTDLTELIREAALESVRQALAGAPIAKPRGRKKTAKKAAPKTGKRVRRTAADVEKLGNAILAHVKLNPAQRLGDIAKGLGVETKDARRPAFALLDEGKLKTTGQKGGTRYFVAGAAPKKKPAVKKAAKKTTKKAAKKKTAKKAAKKKTAKKATPKKAGKRKAAKA